MGRATVFREELLLGTANSYVSSVVAEIGRSMSAALNQGNAVVCIATGTQRRLFEEQMKIRGIDIVGALVREQLVCLNALDSLTTIMVDGVPDVIRFAEVIGASVDRAAMRYPRVQLFGEFASLQCSNQRDALRLNALWESFVNSRPVFIRCFKRAEARQEQNREGLLDGALALCAQPN